MRTEQTVLALGRRYRVRHGWPPTARRRGAELVVQWPNAAHPALVVGHQPTLGRVVAGLLGIESGGECSIRKERGLVAAPPRTPPGLANRAAVRAVAGNALRR